MLIYMKPGTRMRAVAVTALVLILLGARVGVSLYGGEEEAVAKISPLSRVNTTLPNIGVMVDVSGADAEQISAALATLDSLGIKATWFADATTVESCTQVIKDIAAKGNEFGIKGTDQKAIDKLSSLEVKDRLLRSRQAFAQAGVDIVPFLYPPSGRYSETVVAVAFQGGLESVKQALDASTMRGKEDAAASKLVGSMKPGDFLLLRVGKKGLQPAQAYLVALQESLFERQITAVPLSALVKGVK